MSGFTRSPQLVKGAIVAFDLFNPIASVVIFQYNPTTVSRSLSVQRAGQGGARSEVLRLTGAPQETISLSVHLNASDQLEVGDSVASAMGVYPQLSALEMLTYPKTAQVLANASLMLSGTTEIIPPEAPFTLFVWGSKRVVPVSLTSLTVNEQQFDTELNPILAEVDLQLRVLSYNDFSMTHAGFSVFLAHQATKEAMAVVGSISNLSSVGSFIP